MPTVLRFVLASILLTSAAGAAAQSTALARILPEVRLEAFSSCLQSVEDLGGGAAATSDEVLDFLYADSDPSERMLACLVTPQGTRWSLLTGELPGWTAAMDEGDLLTGTWEEGSTDPPTTFRAAAIGGLGRDKVAVVADRYVPVARVEPDEYARAVGDAVQAYLEATRSQPASDCTSGYNAGNGFVARGSSVSLASCTVKAELASDEEGVSYEYEIRYETVDGDADARSGAGFVFGDR